MSNIIQAIFDKFQPYRTYILIAFLIIVFGIAGYFVYNKIFRPTQITKEKGYDDIPNRDKTSGDSVEIMFFFASWCPHCKNAKPIWTSFKNEHNETQVNGKRIVFTEIDCSDNDDEHAVSMIKQYNIEGFPTVKAVSGDKTIDFDASITEDNLNNFITSIT